MHTAQTVRRLFTPPPGVTPVEVPTETREAAEDVQARQEAAAAVRRRLYTVPGRFRDASYATLTPHQDVDGRVSRWWGSDSKTLLLISERKGTGKSHAAYAVGNEVVATGVTVVAHSLVHLMRVAKPSNDPAAFDLACTAPLLILDDLGKERETEWSEERLQELIEARWASDSLRTVVTTNLGGATIYDRYDESIIDRLIDDSWSVRFDGPSWRSPAPFADPS